MVNSTSCAQCRRYCVSPLWKFFQPRRSPSCTVCLVYASLSRKGRTVRLRVEGDAEALTATIQARPYALRDLEVTPVHLEEVLLEYIKGDAE